MGTIWTPSGEQPVGDEGARGDQPQPPEELEAELAEVQRQLLETPASVIIANHAIGMFLPEAGAVRERERVVRPLVGDRAVAGPDVPEDPDVLAHPRERLGERLPVPALDHLRPRDPQPEDQPKT